MVADFGGPGDIIHPNVGYKVPLTNQNEMVAQMQKILAGLAQDRDLLNRLRRQGMSYARECLTWDAKAQSTTRVLNWVVGRGPKPRLVPPKMLHLEPRADLEKAAGLRTQIRHWTTEVANRRAPFR